MARKGQYELRTKPLQLSSFRSYSIHVRIWPTLALSMAILPSSLGGWRCRIVLLCQMVSMSECESFLFHCRWYSSAQLARPHYFWTMQARIWLTYRLYRTKNNKFCCEWALTFDTIPMIDSFWFAECCFRHLFTPIYFWIIYKTRKSISIERKTAEDPSPLPSDRRRDDKKFEKECKRDGSHVNVHLFVNRMRIQCYAIRVICSTFHSLCLRFAVSSWRTYVTYTTRHSFMFS